MFGVGQSIIINDIENDINEKLGTVAAVLSGDNYSVRLAEDSRIVVVSQENMKLASQQAIIEDRSKRFLDEATA